MIKTVQSDHVFIVMNKCLLSEWE